MEMASSLNEMEWGYIPSQVETAWLDILRRGRLILQAGPEFARGYLMQVCSYSRKRQFGPFDLVQKKKSRSKRMSTKRLEHFFAYVNMHKPGHIMRFVDALMNVGVEGGVWKLAPLSERVQLRLSGRDSTTAWKASPGAWRNANGRRGS